MVYDFQVPKTKLTCENPLLVHTTGVMKKRSRVGAMVRAFSYYYSVMLIKNYGAEVIRELAFIIEPKRI